MITADDLESLIRAVVDRGDPLVLDTLVGVLRLAIKSDPGSELERAELAAAIRESRDAADLGEPLLAASVSPAGADNPRRKRRRRLVERLESLVSRCGQVALVVEGLAGIASETAADLRRSADEEEEIT